MAMRPLNAPPTAPAPAAAHPRLTSHPRTDSRRRAIAASRSAARAAASRQTRAAPPYGVPIRTRAAPRQGGLSEAAIARLPRFPAPAAPTGDDQCAICFDSFEGPRLLIALPCVHKFHAECVAEWLRHRGDCPQCQLDLTVIHSTLPDDEDDDQFPKILGSAPDKAAEAAAPRTVAAVPRQPRVRPGGSACFMLGSGRWQLPGMVIRMGGPTGVNWVAEKLFGPAVGVAWTADGDAASCVGCSGRFSFTRRRHHCRGCGAVVCATCSPRRVLRGYVFRQRCCAACARKFTSGGVVVPLWAVAVRE